MTRSAECSSPRQNRVTPFGEIVAIPERGTMMGNRGILHDEHGRLRRRWATRAWICCVLDFRGRRDPVMAPGHYTRLFFLDEVTALAAGHRPCAYCRRPAYNAFRDAWAAGNARLGLGAAPKATEIDRVLNDERLGPGGVRRLHRAELDGLPDGTFLALYPDDRTDSGSVVAGQAGMAHVRPGRIADHPAGDVPAYLLWQGRAWRWSPAGYQPAAPLPSGPVLMLTPPTIVAALESGYRPEPPARLSV